MKLFFVDEHCPHVISYQVIEETPQGFQIIARNASVRMLEIMTTAHPGSVYEMSQADFNRLISNQRGLPA